MRRALVPGGLAVAATLAIALTTATAAPSPALAAVQPPPQVGIADIEDEVMCPVCGTLLELADSPQARREKALVRRLIAEGKSKDQVKDELVAQYGDDVLAVPGGSGFDLSAYLVPAVALLLAAIGVGVGVWRWRREGGPRDGPPASPPPGDADAARLDADIARYDL
jgi:cytochrome c-type biogenesis protein CcmH